MNVITVSREYGAGGGELARLLAEELGWELLDRELLHRAAAIEHIPDADLERFDEKSLSFADRLFPQPLHERYLRGLTEAVRQAAARGNVVLVGRGANHLVGPVANALHVCLVAPHEWRVSRLAQRQGWDLTTLAQQGAIDRGREHFLHYFFGPDATRPEQFDLVVNSARVPLPLVAALVMSAVREAPPSGTETASPRKRVLTLSRQLGAGDTGFAPTLAERLGLRVFDRELLEHEAGRLGVSAAELDTLDEQPAGLWQRLLPGSLYRRYVEALERLMKERATEGDVLLVGRGGNRFLGDWPGAFHARLVAALPIRIARVMEHRWLREEPARSLIAQSDAHRQRFYENCFGGDWSSPLEYHVIVNSGRLGPTAVDLVARAAQLYWDKNAEGRMTKE